jgi:hypothetical protein
MMLPGKSLFSPEKPPAPVPLPALPQRDDAAIARRKQEERDAAARRRSRSDTILTSGLGDVSEARTTRATLG